MNINTINNYNINNYDNNLYNKALKQRYYDNVNYVYKNKDIIIKINDIEYKLYEDFKNNKLTYIEFHEKYDKLQKLKQFIN